MKHRTANTSRLRVVGISRKMVLAGSLIPTAVAVAICAAVGADLDRSIGIAGSVLAVVTFGLSQLQAEGPRSRSAVMIPKSRSPFSSTVHRGLADLLGHYPHISLSTEWPAAPAPDEVMWQLAQLRSPQVLRADAIVIVPAGDDERIWSELARASRAGVFVVVVDTKPQNAFFASRQAPRPCFVGSDFGKGGELVGHEICRVLTENTSSRAVVAIGPRWSFPGVERSRGIAYAMCAGRVTDRALFVEIDTWDRSEATKRLTAAVRKAIAEIEADPTGRVVVFCGNDKILDAAERALLRETHPLARDRVFLIGYDGAIAPDGQLMAYACQMAIGTVDTKPEEQGRAAAQVLIDEHRGLLNGRASWYIEPKLVSFGRAAAQESAS